MINGNGTKERPFVHDPQAKLDYVYPWKEWLLSVADTLAISGGFVVTAAAPMVVLAQTADPDGNVIARMGCAPGAIAGQKGSAICHIKTAAGLEDDRTMFFKIDDR